MTALLAALALLLAAEITLRLARRRPGRPPRPADAAAATGDALPTLLCVGDSNTYGLNLPRGESYPCHLQQLVGPRARVVNKGWPGANSSLMAAYLPGWIAAERPAVVYVMAGINNRHNPLGGTYQALVDRGLYAPSRGERVRRAAHRLLWHSHLYRLAFWRFGAGAGGWTEAVEGTDEVYGYYRDRPYDSYEGATAHSERRDTPDPWARLERGGLEDAEVTAEIAGYFEALGPRAEASEYDINLLRFAKTRLGATDFQAVLAAARRNLPVGAVHLLTDAVDTVAGDFGLVEQMLWFDLAQMLNACRDAGAQLMVLTYPSQVFEPLVAEFATRHDVPWIDSGAAFGWLGPARGHKTPDGKRLGSAGNRLLAEHVLAETLRTGPPVFGTLREL